MQAQSTPARAARRASEEGSVRTNELTEEADFEGHAYAERQYTQPELLRTKDVMDNLGEALDGLAEDFGEVLRHELNNPLTGILGNAELLLSEIRRNDDGRPTRGRATTSRNHRDTGRALARDDSPAKPRVGSTECRTARKVRTINLQNLALQSEVSSQIRDSQLLSS